MGHFTSQMRMYNDFLAKTHPQGQDPYHLHDTSKFEPKLRNSYEFLQCLLVMPAAFEAADTKKFVTTTNLSKDQ